MIKNIVFDIGNVILNFDISDVLNKFTDNKEDQQFILKNIINSPEWLGYSLIDTGYIEKKDAIKIVQDRTNHSNDLLIEKFWNNYNDYANINNKTIDLIIKLKEKEYKIYLLSNINPYTYEFMKKSNIFDIVDGYVLSYKEHQVKPNIGIYKTLIKRYNINPHESLFIDDNINNIKTGKLLEFISEKVEPDDYNSIEKVINKYNLIKF